MPTISDYEMSRRLLVAKAQEALTKSMGLITTEHGELTALEWLIQAEEAEAMKQTRLTQREFENLPEYSCSIPTGVFIGKQWKCDLNFGKPTARHDWIIREYVPHSTDPDLASIRNSRPHIMNEDEELIHNRLFGGKR